jgi:O-antigen/teichoic acid export membrane protein
VARGSGRAIGEAELRSLTEGVEGTQPPSASDLAERQSARDDDGEPEGVPDAGAVRNTVLQFATQLVGLVFTGALTLYLVRALGPSGYGLYALAISIASLLLLPAGLGLPTAVGRFLADHRGDLGQVRAILGFGMRLQAPAAAVAGVALFAAAGAVAAAFGEPELTWPLRWAAVAVAGQAVFSFLNLVSTSVRQSRLGLWMALAESAVETVASASLVLAGAGAAGATLGRAIGYGVGAAVGLILALRLLRRPRDGGVVRLRLSRRTLMRYAGVMFVVDLGFSALAQLDVLLIGALLSSAAVGAFSAVWRILVVLGYLGIAVAGGVAPRLSLGGDTPDTRLFGQGIRYLLIVQGLVIAPMLVWAKPIVTLLLGPGYGSSIPILRVLTVVAFVSPPAALISSAVTYLGEGRRRIVVVLGTLVVGFWSIYALIRAVGLVGAAIGDDVIVVVYVSAHLWICTRLITVDLRTLAWSFVRTLMAAGAMTLPLLALGVDHLTAVQWVIGLVAGGLVYAAVLLITRELSSHEVRSVAERLRSGLSRNPPANHRSAHPGG